tara:strand:- start:2468 stop:2842 length:375 start_codon:yes stop_codon:yes gene_type:complete
MSKILNNNLKVCIVCESPTDLSTNKLCGLCTTKQQSGLLAVIGVNTHLNDSELDRVHVDEKNWDTSPYFKRGGKYTHVPIAVLHHNMEPESSYLLPNDYIVVKNDMIELLDQMTHEDYAVEYLH